MLYIAFNALIEVCFITSKNDFWLNYNEIARAIVDGVASTYGLKKKRKI